jgi:hypothetical protein
MEFCEYIRVTQNLSGISYRETKLQWESKSIQIITITNIK